MANPSATIPFPGQSLSPNMPLKFRLQSGAALVIPNGNFQVKPGGQSAVQWFDSNSGLWQSYEAAAVNAPIDVASDGTNFRVINLSGTIVGANVTTPGTVYTQVGTTVTFAAPATGITATATPIIGGSLTFAVTTAGTGYTNPTIILPGPQILGGTPGLCIPASISVSLTGTALNAITTDFAGAGYVTAPAPNTITVTPAQFTANLNYYLGLGQIIIVDPTGTGAVITATLANGTAASGGLTGVIMTNYGSGYDGTHIPAVTITCAGSSATAAATALPNMALTGVTVGSTNTGYTASVLGITSSGSGAAASSKINGDPVLAREARFTATQTAGALNTPIIEDPGSGFQTVPLAKQVGNATADGSVNATFTAVVGGVTNTVLLFQVG